MSIGIGKVEIVSQFILETAVIAVLAFGLSYPASSMIADRAGDFIMSQVVDSESLTGEDDKAIQQGDYSSMMDGLSGKPSAENAVKEIDVTIEPMYLIGVYGIGALLVVCAVLIASYTVIRMKPREILSKMS